VPENCQPVTSTTKAEQAKSSEAVTTDHSQSGARKRDRFEMVSCDLAHLAMGDLQRGAGRDLYGIVDAASGHASERLFL
jgi:hypothetical protein